MAVSINTVRQVIEDYFFNAFVALYPDVPVHFQNTSTDPPNPADPSNPTANWVWLGLDAGLDDKQSLNNRQYRKQGIVTVLVRGATSEGTFLTGAIADDAATILRDRRINDVILYTPNVSPQGIVDKWDVISITTNYKADQSE